MLIVFQCFASHRTLTSVVFASSGVTSGRFSWVWYRGAFHIHLVPVSRTPSCYSRAGSVALQVSFPEGLGLAALVTCLFAPCRKTGLQNERSSSARRSVSLMLKKYGEWP